MPSLATRQAPACVRTATPSRATRTASLFGSCHMVNRRSWSGSRLRLLFGNTGIAINGDAPSLKILKKQVIPKFGDVELPVDNPF